MADKIRKICDRSYKGRSYTARLKDGVPVCPGCGFPISEHK